MALTPSTMLALGTPAPGFSLPDTADQVVSLEDFRGRGRPLLVMFICNHCPYVKHIAPGLARLGRDYQGRVDIIAIQSNDVDNHPDDAPDKMAQEVESRGYAFPYLYDATQDVAKAYTAACTPDFFLFDADHKLAYRGQFDSTRPVRIQSGVYDTSGQEASGQDLRRAIDAVLAGQAPSEPQQPSIGCNIKWKPGQAPDYFG